MEEIDALEKIIIPKTMKPEIMQELHRMNITAKTLFSGIDGLGKSMYEYCKSLDTNSIIT